jgi:ABC-type transport system substrate-binding protein
MDPSTYGWDPSWTPDPYDVAKAKSLLAEVGYPEKYSNPVITLVAQAGPVADLLQVLQGYWDAVGIKTTIKVCDPMTYGGLFFVRNEDPKGDNVGDVVCWIYAGFFDTIYHCANMYTSKGVHSTGADPQADVLYAKATSELDPVKAKQYWTEFQNYAYSMWVSVGVCYQPTYVVVGPKVGSFGDQAWKSVNECYIGIQPK